MQLAMRLSRCSRKDTYSLAYKFLKDERMVCLIWVGLVTQWPSSDLIASMWFLLLMMVERWKNFVFLYPAFNQSSRDFCFHKISLLKSHSDNSSWSSSSTLPLCSEDGFFWTSVILSVRRLILAWQCPNTSLFHLQSASLVLAYFLKSLKKAKPLVCIFQAFSTIELHPLSLIQAASNLNGLWAKLSSRLVSNRIGVWSDLKAPR